MRIPYQKGNHMLYDYFNDAGYVGIIGFVILVGVLLGLMVWVSVPVIRLFCSRKIREHPYECIARSFILLILCVFCFFAAGHLSKAVTHYCEYTAESYDTVTGRLHHVDSVPSEGRGEYYSVSFHVDDLSFKNTNISIDRKTVDIIKAAEGKEVTVCYQIENGEQFIYRISVLKE